MLVATAALFLHLVGLDVSVMAWTTAFSCLYDSLSDHLCIFHFSYFCESALFRLPFASLPYVHLYILYYVCCSIHIVSLVYIQNVQLYIYTDIWSVDDMVLICLGTYYWLCDIAICYWLAESTAILYYINKLYMGR